MLDPVRNFISIEVSTGYDDTDTEIVLDEGGGDLLPDVSSEGEFNLTWYNSSDYPNPSDDPNVEIVRVTDITDDTLTITRAQEDTSASVKNLGGKVYKVILTPTKKTIEDLENAILQKSIEVTAPVEIDGTTTPKPVALTSVGIFEADANGGADLQKFFGFLKEHPVPEFPEHIYTNSTEGNSVSLTIPAGNDIVLFVVFQTYSSGGTLPSSATFNGQAMTLVQTQAASGSSRGSVWRINLGNLASPLTANVVKSGHSGTQSGQAAIAYKDIDQSSPVDDSDSRSNAGTITGLTNDRGAARILAIRGGGSSPSITGSSSRVGFGVNGNIGDLVSAIPATLTCTGASDSNWFIGISLNAASSIEIPKANVIYDGEVDGFSGLTPGATYYVTDTAGAIGTTAGTNNIRVGVALTATKLLIVR